MVTFAFTTLENQVEEVEGKQEAASVLTTSATTTTVSSSPSALSTAGKDQVTKLVDDTKIKKIEDTTILEKSNVGSSVASIATTEMSTDMSSASTQTPIFEETDSPSESDPADKNDKSREKTPIHHRYSGLDYDSKTDMIMVHLPEGTEIKQEDRSTLLDKYDNDCRVQYENGHYKCIDCDYITDKRVNCYKHRRKHLGIKPYVCSTCNYSAATSSNLKRHLAQHTDTRQYGCYLCDAFFRQKIHLERHIKYKHEEKKVKCPLCDYVCANENPDLKVHIKRKHMPQEVDEASVESFTCDDCGLVAVTKRDLKQHMKFHRTGPELKLFCFHCSFVTDCESRLKRHMLVHTKEKPYKCGLCDYCGTQKEHVVRHMKAQHDVNFIRRSKKLDAQSSDSSNDSQVKLSEKADYTSQEKIFACNHCTMKFSKLINLYKHLYAQHKHIMPPLQEGEYSCVVCDFRTTVKKNLLVHMRRHNIQEQRPPSHVYSCVLCKYMNPKRRNLFQHMKKKHRIEIVMKEDGSTNCFLIDDNDTALTTSEPSNVLTIGDLVTATATADLSSEIISEDSLGNGIENEVTIEDINYTYPKSNRSLLVTNAKKPQTITIADLNEAQEAIEGLQALSEQRENVHYQATDDDHILSFDPNDADDDENSTDSALQISELESPKTSVVQIIGAASDVKDARVIAFPSSEHVPPDLTQGTNVIQVIHPPEMLGKSVIKKSTSASTTADNPVTELETSNLITTQAEFIQIAQPLTEANDENAKVETKNDLNPLQIDQALIEVNENVKTAKKDSVIVNPLQVSQPLPEGNDENMQIETESDSVIVGQVNPSASVHLDTVTTEPGVTYSEVIESPGVKAEHQIGAIETNICQSEPYQPALDTESSASESFNEKVVHINVPQTQAEEGIVMEVIPQSDAPEATFIQLDDSTVLTSDTSVFQLADSNQNIVEVIPEQPNMTDVNLTVSEEGGSAEEAKNMVIVNEVEDRTNIQLTEQDILQLSSNDIVEINGELYRVEATESDDSTSQIGLVPFASFTLPS